MVRRLVGAVVVLALAVGVTVAAEIRGIITKIDGDKVTFTEFKGKEKGDSKTLPVAADVKVLKAAFSKDKKAAPGEALEGGLKNKMFSKIGEKGMFATIVTDADNKKITEIRVFGGGIVGKKKKDK